MLYVKVLIRMNTNTACRIAGSATNKKTRNAKHNAALQRYKNKNPIVNSYKVNKLSTALQTISQVCDGSTRVSPRSGQKVYDELVKLGLDSYVYPSNTPTPDSSAPVSVSIPPSNIAQQLTEISNKLGELSKQINTALQDQKGGRKRRTRRYKQRKH